MYNRETGDYQTTKGYKAGTTKGEQPLGETSSNKVTKNVFGSTDVKDITMWRYLSSGPSGGEWLSGLSL